MTVQPPLFPDPHAAERARQRRARRRWLLAQARQLRKISQEQARMLREATRPNPEPPEQEEKP